jgi:glutathionyl-hydroquinone reductase
LKITDEFPQDFYVELTGLSPDYVGRITIYQNGSKYNLEIDIVQNESGKIYTHVDSLYDRSDARDSVDFSMHILKKFLDSKRH